MSDIYDITYEEILSAFSEFDEHYRLTFQYKGKLEYAVFFSGNLYPTKPVVRIAKTGSIDITDPDFSGTDSKLLMLERGFYVVQILSKEERIPLNISVQDIYNDQYTIYDVIKKKNGIRLVETHYSNDDYSEILGNALNAWIFQWNPDEYDTFEDFYSGKLLEPWRVNSHWRKMSPGDVGLLWKTSNGDYHSKGEAGIYGLGRLMGTPSPAAPDDICKYRVLVEYISLLPVPLLKGSLQRHPVLKSLANRVTQGSNFRVDPEEWGSIRSILEVMNFSTEESHMNGRPSYQVSEVGRFKRDSKLVRTIKYRVNHFCQVCNNRILIDKNTYYSEAHHLQPLGREHKGTDDEDNIIIVCPNHHTEFDYGSIAVNPKTQLITHIDQTNKFHNKKLAYERKLNEKFLKYHYYNIYRG